VSQGVYLALSEASEQPTMPCPFLLALERHQQVKYMVDACTATGTCAVCIVGGERSLVANLAAANNFKV
jgi:hypothetical protein